MNAGDTPLGTAEAFGDRTRELGTAYLSLSRDDSVTSVPLDTNISMIKPKLKGKLVEAERKGPAQFMDLPVPSTTTKPVSQAVEVSASSSGVADLGARKKISFGLKLGGRKPGGAKSLE